MACSLALLPPPPVPHTHTHTHTHTPQERHPKGYMNDLSEVAKRFSIWLANLEYILEYNAKTTTHWLGLNSLADLTKVCTRAPGRECRVACRCPDSCASKHPRQMHFQFSPRCPVPSINPLSKDWITRGGYRVGAVGARMPGIGGMGEA